ncbi:hypothetical protein HDU92_003371 [Lobulomyces angularis]|nr:hypothetical protein HDU92_003371 [Lobulomyces angularis]
MTAFYPRAVISTETEINAPSSTVFDVLLNCSNYPTWNPMIKHIHFLGKEKKFVVGSRAILTVGSLNLPIPVKIKSIQFSETRSEIGWEGVGIPIIDYIAVSALFYCISSEWVWTSDLPAELVSTDKFLISIQAPVNDGTVKLISQKLKPYTFDESIKNNGVIEFPGPFSYGNDGSIHGYDNLQIYFENELVLEKQVYIYPSTLSIAGLYDNSFIFGNDPIASAVLFMSVLNDDPTILPHTTLTLSAYASNCSTVISAKSTMEILSNSSYIVIHGPDCSAPTFVDAIMTGAFEIPLISSSASAAQLSNKRSYPYFMRTQTSSASESTALLNAIKYFNFTHIIAISTDQFPFPEDFYALANRLNISLVANIILNSGQVDFSKQLGLIPNLGVTVIVSNIQDNGEKYDAKVLYEHAMKFGLFEKPYTWFFGSTAGLDFLYYVPDKNRLGMFSTYSSYGEVERIDYATAIVEKWNNYDGNLDTIRDVNFEVGKSNIKNFWDMVSRNATKYHVSGSDVDAILTIANSLHEILYVKKITLDGKTLYATMRNQSFKGFNGQVFFDQNGDRPQAFGLYSFTDQPNNDANSSVYVGSLSWDPVSLIGEFVLETNTTFQMKFSSNTTEKPIGLICPANCGNGTCALPLQCICNSGYTRDVNFFQNKNMDCTVPLCQTPCKFGECITPNVCKCQKNYFGEDCSIYYLELQTPGITYQFYNGIIGVINIVLAVLAVAVFIGLKYSSFNKVKKFGLDLLQFTVFGTVLGHAGTVTGMIFPNQITCTLKYVLFVSGLTLLLSSLLIRSWRIYYIFERPSSVSSATIITFNKLVMFTFIFVGISAIGLVVSILTDTPSTNILTDVDLDYFYLACTLPTNIGGIIGLVIIALNILLLLIMFLMVAQLSKGVPAGFKESKTSVISYLTFFILVSLTVVEYLKYSETIKTALFGILSAMLFSIPTFFVVIPKLHFVLSKKSRKGADKISTHSLQSSSSSSANITLIPIKKLGNEVSMGNFAHLTPGLLGKWTRKVAYYDRKTNFFTMVNSTSLERDEKPLTCFQINGKNAKVVYKPLKKVEDKVGNMSFNEETVKKLDFNSEKVDLETESETFTKETIEFMIVCGGENHRVLLLDEEKDQIKLWKNLADELSKTSNRTTINVSTKSLKDA